jgi:hypothetical protein
MLNGYVHTEETGLKNLPVLVLALGAFLILATAILAIRLIWEMTWLTWKLGPQMIGFSLAHGSGAILFAAPVALFIWLILCLCIVGFWKVKKAGVQRRTWMFMGAAAIVLGTLAIPSSFWDRLFVAKLARSSHSTAFLIEAAGLDEPRVLKALLQRGISINAADHSGDTALHVAAAQGNASIVSYLINHGAEINAVNLYGDSPLQRAIENHQDQTIQILSAKGAKIIKGDDAQRERAAEEIVRRQMEEMHPH